MSSDPTADVTHPPPGTRAVRRVARRLAAWGVPRAQAFYAVVGVWLGLAFVLAFLAFWAFVALAGNVAAGETQRIDEAVMHWLNARGTPGLDKVGRSVTELGSGLVMAVMALLVSTFLWIHGERRAVALLWIGLAGVYLLDDVLKDFFERARPEVFAWRTVRPSGYAFPSGHSLNATVGYTLFAFLVARLERSRRLRAATFAVAATLVAAVAVSRVYLGVHYPSDVLAGVLIGFAWAMACVLSVYVLRDLRAPRPPR
jgi:undecaprenyl-diphosphatase